MTTPSTRLFGLICYGLVTMAMLLAAASPAAEETPSHKAATLLDGLIQTNDPGVAVLVAQDGKILFEKGYGLADREHAVPVTPQTTFCIASVTKQFTGAAILKLQEKGKLSIDDKLSKYVPEFPRGNDVTLRHLLSHTSGIHNYDGDSGFQDCATNCTAEAIVEAMKKQPFDFDPGTKWRYANSDYMLLGYIVEKVSGQSYADFLRENFFQPLGMTNTGVYSAHSDFPRQAVGYCLGTNGFESAQGFDWSWFGGAGALCSTVEDLCRWNEGIFNGRALNAASLKAAFTPVKTTKNQINSDTGYGFGWGLSRYRGLRIIWHPGGGPGFSSILLRVPDEKFTVAILANAMPGSTNVNINALMGQLVDIFLANKVAPLPVVNTSVSPKSYALLTGRYDYIPSQVWGPYWGYILTISQRGTRLFSQFGDAPEQELFPESRTRFFWKEGGDACITFVKGSGGRAVKLVFHRSGSDTIAPRVKDIAQAKVNPAVYDRLAGKYDYCYRTALTITREENHFFAQLDGEPKYEFFPKSETEYFSKAVDAQLTFVKDAAGKVTKAIVHQGDESTVAPRIQ